MQIRNMVVLDSVRDDSERSVPFTIDILYDRIENCILLMAVVLVIAADEGEAGYGRARLARKRQ